MRHLFSFILFSVFLVSCNTKNENSSSKNSTVNSNGNIESPLVVDTKENTWRFEVLNTLNENATPHWSYRLKKGFKLSNSLTVLIFELSDAVCTYDYVASYLNQVEVEFMEVSENCDRDISKLPYSWTEFEFISSKSFVTRKYTERIRDSLNYGNGLEMQESDNSEKETVVGSIKKTFEIRPNGKIASI